MSANASVLHPCTRSYQSGDGGARGKVGGGGTVVRSVFVAPGGGAPSSGGASFISGGVGRHSASVSPGMAEAQDVSRLLRLARQFNCFYLHGLHVGECKPFIVEGHQVGLVRSDFLKHLSRYPEVFQVSGKCVELNPAFRDYKERTVKVADVLQKLRQEDCLSTLRGWRNECYAVSTPGYPDLFEMERSATCLFGIQKYGVTINGYVRHPTKGLCLWYQQRSNTKQTWPGKWDNMVGGGLSVGFGILETAIKEAAEEASVPSSLANTMTPVGCVSFFFESERGLFPNTEFIYDMELPIDFIPDNSDGEVQSFELLTISESLDLLFSPTFKTTSAPVVIDFLIRWGLITPDNEPNYAELVELLHVPLRSIYKMPFHKQENGRPDSDVVHSNFTKL